MLRAAGAGGPPWGASVDGVWGPDSPAPSAQQSPRWLTGVWRLLGFPLLDVISAYVTSPQTRVIPPHTQAYPSDWAARGDIDYLRSPEDEELSQFRLQWFAAMSSTFWQQTGSGRLPILTEALPLRCERKEENNYSELSS